MNKETRLAGWWVMCPSSIGTWVRFPGPPLFPYIFSHYMFRYPTRPEVHHMLSSMACQVAMSVHPVARNQSPWNTPVNAYVCDLKSQHESSFYWAKLLQSYLQNWVNHPPCLPFLSLFLFFSFILIILFVLFNSIKLFLWWKEIIRTLERI